MAQWSRIFAVLLQYKFELHIVRTVYNHWAGEGLGHRNGAYISPWHFYFLIILINTCKILKTISPQNMTIKLKDEETLISLFVILERARRLSPNISAASYVEICKSLQMNSLQISRVTKYYNSHTEAVYYLISSHSQICETLVWRRRN